MEEMLAQKKQSKKAKDEEFREALKMQAEQNAQILENINSTLKSFKEGFKPSLEVKHTLDKFEVIKSLKSTLNEATEQMKRLDIPSQIVTKQEITTKIDIKDRTLKFLIWFVSISFVVLFCSVYFGIYGYEQAKRAITAEEAQELRFEMTKIKHQNSWLITFHNRIKGDCPKSAKSIKSELGEYPK